MVQTMLKTIFVFLPLVSAGCATVPGPVTPVPFKVGGLDIVSKSAEMQMIVFQTPDDVEKLCLAPAPDAVPTTANSFSVGARGESIGESGGASADVLGGRGQAVLVIRELLYRTCEFSLNYRLDGAAALALYRETLDRIERIAPALSSAGTAPLVSVPTLGSGQNGDDDDDGDGDVTPAPAPAGANSK